MFSENKSLNSNSVVEHSQAVDICQMDAVSGVYACFSGQAHEMLVLSYVTIATSYMCFALESKQTKKDDIIGGLSRKKGYLLNWAFPESGKDILFSAHFCGPCQVYYFLSSQLVSWSQCKRNVAGVRYLLIALQECWNKNITC